MGLVAWIVIGAIAGFLANFIMRGGFGLIMTIVLGIVGAVIAGYVSNALRGSTDAFGLDFVGIVMSTFFAIIVVGVAKVASGRSGGD
jgi:uncharacterized membrane protein YeaQ/YmgE (transglycosylase-associated protein family)